MSLPIGVLLACSPNRYFQIDCPLRTYYFYAETLDDVRNWLRVLSDSKAALKRRERNAARASQAVAVPASPVPQLPSLTPGTLPVSISSSTPTTLPNFPSVPNSAPVFPTRGSASTSTLGMPTLGSLVFAFVSRAPACR